jgi:hypothetical protein
MDDTSDLEGCQRCYTCCMSGWAGFRKWLTTPLIKREPQQQGDVVEQYIQELEKLDHVSKEAYYFGLFASLIGIVFIFFTDTEQTMGVQPWMAMLLLLLGITASLATFRYCVLQHSFIRKRLINSYLASRIAAHEFEIGEIFSHIPIPLSWLFRFIRLISSDLTTRGNVIMLLSNLDWYTLRSRRLIRSRWIAFPAFLLAMVIVPIMLPYMLPELHHNAIWYRQWVFVQVFADTKSWFACFWAVWMVDGFNQQVRAVWHMELLDYFRAYIAKHDDAGVSQSVAATTSI